MTSFLHYFLRSLPLAAVLFLTGILSAQTPIAYIPLTPAERWDQYWHDTILSPGLYVAALGAAGGEQLSKDPPEWGGGVKGYSRRTATLLARYATQATISDASAAALHYDSRYLHCECHGNVRRVTHAFGWSFLTKNESGQTRFNLPEMAGVYAAGIIPYLWYPSRFSPLKDGLREGNQELGFVVGLNLVREFSPEIRRIVHLKPQP